MKKPLLYYKNMKFLPQEMKVMGDERLVIKEAKYVMPRLIKQVKGGYYGKKN